MKRAIFPGSFDPITIGHESLIRRSISLFDEIIVAIGVNSTKKTLFSLEQRVSWLESVFSKEPKVKITTYTGLTAKFCKQVKASYIIRGLRSGIDFEYEKPIAQMNAELNNEIETIFLVCEPKFSAISSTIVRDIYINNGDITPFIPKGIKLK